MRVFVTPEKRYEDFGAERLELSWERVRLSARYKIGTGEDIDPDGDIEYLFAHFKMADKAKAVAYARALIDGLETAYGQVTMTRQIVDWFVKEDRIAEWADTQDIEYID